MPEVLSIEDEDDFKDCSGEIFGLVRRKKQKERLQIVRNASIFSDASF